MSTLSFLNIGMHGYINPTLPVVAELVRRGHVVTYHTFPAFADEIKAAGARVYPYQISNPLLPEPTPISLLDDLVRSSLRLLPDVLSDLRRIQPDMVVHGAACPWGALAARELGLPAVAFFTTFAFDKRVPSPMRMSATLLAAAMAHPKTAVGFIQARRRLSRQFDCKGLPFIDFLDVRAPLNIVFTSGAFQPQAEGFDSSYRFVGASVGSRPSVPEFAAVSLEDPVLYASLGTVFQSRPELLRAFASGLSPLGGTVVVSTGNTAPEQLGQLPPNVLACRSVPQLQLLERAALFVTHGGMNSVNEAMRAGVPSLVVPQGADQPLVARRVVEVGAGLALQTKDVTRQTVYTMARRLLEESSFRNAAAIQRDAQIRAGGAVRAADEIELYMIEARRDIDPGRRRRA